MRGGVLLKLQLACLSFGETGLDDVSMAVQRDGQAAFLWIAPARERDRDVTEEEEEQPMDMDTSRSWPPQGTKSAVRAGDVGCIAHNIASAA